MGKLKKFEKEFVDAYMAGRVNCVGIHDTNASSFQSRLRKGLKWFPYRSRVIRREMGVHFHRLRPYRNGLNREIVKNEFERFCASKAHYEFQEGVGDLPGIVLVGEGVPRERKYWDSWEREPPITSHRYVPIKPGLENTTHILVPSQFILDVIFLDREESEDIEKKADKTFGTTAELLYKREKGKLKEKAFSKLWYDREGAITHRWGRLLLYKARDYLFK